jgi:hypothetical protein
MNRVMEKLANFSTKWLSYRSYSLCQIPHPNPHFYLGQAVGRLLRSRPRLDVVMSYRKNRPSDGVLPLDLH